MSLDLDLIAVREVSVWSSNITHNLGAMAHAAGLYEVLWRPEDRNMTAADAIPMLEAGIARLEKNPDVYRPMNPANGWGSYEALLEFARATLAACRENSDARLRASR